MAFHLNHKQVAALDLLGGDQTHTLLSGGSRSGKTFLIVRSIIVRAMKVPRSRHLMARFALVDIEASLVAETWPNVIRLCFPQLEHEIEKKTADRFFRMPNDSEVWWAGLGDKEQVERILGKEFATVFCNECSQIPWGSRNMVMTRLAQKTYLPNPSDLDGKLGLPLHPGLRLKAYYDQNPPNETHWTYKLFVQHVSPDTGKRIADPENYKTMRLNPVDNAENLDPQYLKELAALPDRMRKRFLEGQYGDAGEAALWTSELLEQQKLDNEDDIPNLQRVIIAIDPSGARDVTDTTRDEIGIVVAALGEDGQGYVLEDLTMRGSPAEWGQAAVRAYHRWGASRIVAETNFGGAMVKAVIEAAAKAVAEADNETASVAFAEVTASRGKMVRAEPVAALYEQRRIWHVRGLDGLETEMRLMTTAGYTGERSPNRLDAAVWAITYLFLALVKRVNDAASGRGPTSPVMNLGHAGMKSRMAAVQRRR